MIDYKKVQKEFEPKKRALIFFEKQGKTPICFWGFLGCPKCVLLRFFA